MDLELATTHDILMELRRRKMHFAFVGAETRNRMPGNTFFACYGDSRLEILQLLRLMRARVIQAGGSDAGINGEETK